MVDCEGRLPAAGAQLERTQMNGGLSNHLSLNIIADGTPAPAADRTCIWKQHAVFLHVIARLSSCLPRGQLRIQTSLRCYSGRRCLSARLAQVRATSKSEVSQAYITECILLLHARSCQMLQPVCPRSDPTTIRNVDPQPCCTLRLRTST